MAVFTDAQINEIISLITQNLGHRQYIGARYVPIFGRKGEESIEWDNTAPYEPLTIVLHEGNSFTSRQFVPTGIDILNTDFWANTGNYNAQIEQYRQTVLSFDGRITDNTNAISNIQSGKTSVFSTVNEMVTDTENGWKYAIVIDGSTDKYCFTTKIITYERIKSDNPNFTCNYLYVLANGDKAMPCIDFDNVICNPESHLAYIAPMITNINYEYLSGYGVFTDPFNNAGTKVGVCSSLSYMFRTGISPQNSRYELGANANNILAPTANKNPNGAENPENYKDGYMRSHVSAYAAVVNGNGFIPIELADLQVGDILYTGDNTVADTSFMGVNHCEIVVGIDINTGTYTIWEWGGISPTLIRSQGSKWNPCWSIKNFEEAKSTIKIAARYPITSDEISNVIYEHRIVKTYNITDVPWTSITKAASLADGAIIPNGIGMFKITAEVEPTNEEFRLAVQSVGHPNNNNQFVGTSAFSYGGTIEFFAPMAESTFTRVVALPRAQNDMNITVKSLKIEAYQAPEIFNAINTGITPAANLPAIEGATIEISQYMTINNGTAKLIMRFKNIDWTKITTSTVLFSTSNSLKTYGQTDIMLVPVSRNFNFRYEGNNGDWTATQESIPSSSRDMYVSFEFPIFIGSYITTK